MDLVVTNRFEIKGCHYLIILDVFTGYLWIKKMGKTPKTNQVTEALNKIFLTWGYPKHVKSDGRGNIGQNSRNTAKTCILLLIQQAVIIVN